MTNNLTRQTRFTENHNQNNKEDNEGLAERPKRTSPGEKEAFEASETPPGSELRGPSAPGGFQAGSGSCSRAAGLVFSGGGSAGGSWGQVSRRRHAPTDSRGLYSANPVSRRIFTDRTVNNNSERHSNSKSVGGFENRREFMSGEGLRHTKK